MSAKTNPTEPSKDCNELSIQNGRATTPITESGLTASPSTEAPKKKSQNGRVLKPSAKVQAQIDANKANASRVNRINGAESLSDKASRCDFDSNDSINDVFPCMS